MAAAAAAAVVAGAGQAVVVGGQEPLTSSMLAAAQPQEQKQMLGERLFPLIQASHPDMAGKITGMLLEIDNSELLHMLESRESLKAKVRRVVVVLFASSLSERPVIWQRRYLPSSFSSSSSHFCVGSMWDDGRFRAARSYTSSTDLLSSPLVVFHTVRPPLLRSASPMNFYTPINLLTLLTTGM